MPFKVRFAARDPGAANVIRSFIDQWGDSDVFAFDVWLRNQAVERFDGVDYPVRVFADGAGPKELERAWRSDSGGATRTTAPMRSQSTTIQPCRRRTLISRVRLRR